MIKYYIFFIFLPDGIFDRLGAEFMNCIHFRGVKSTLFLIFIIITMAIMITILSSFQILQQKKTLKFFLPTQLSSSSALSSSLLSSSLSLSLSLSSSSSLFFSSSSCFYYYYYCYSFFRCSRSHVVGSFTSCRRSQDLNRMFREAF